MGSYGETFSHPRLIVVLEADTPLVAIQLVKLFGFSPIYTTAFLKHTCYPNSIGATHVLDHTQPLRPEEALFIIYDAISEPDTQREAAALLAPGGALVLVGPPLRDLDLSEGGSMIGVPGSAFHAPNNAVAAGLLAHLE